MGWAQAYPPSQTSPWHWFPEKAGAPARLGRKQRPCLHLSYFLTAGLKGTPPTSLSPFLQASLCFFKFTS